MGLIYKITNLVNGKVYIGQTVKPLQRRWFEHYNCARNNVDTVFYRAIRKYGKENFNVEEIENISDDNLLDEREQYWISYYHSYVGDNPSNGYNSTKGGDGGDTRSGTIHPLTNEILSLYHQNKSYAEIKVELGLKSNHTITRVLLMNGITHEDIESRKKRAWAEKITKKLIPNLYSNLLYRVN